MERILNWSCSLRSLPRASSQLKVASNTYLKQASHRVYFRTHHFNLSKLGEDRCILDMKRSNLFCTAGTLQYGKGISKWLMPHLALIYRFPKIIPWDWQMFHAPHHPSTNENKKTSNTYSKWHHQTWEILSPRIKNPSKLVICLHILSTDKYRNI